MNAEVVLFHHAMQQTESRFTRHVDIRVRVGQAGVLQHDNDVVLRRRRQPKLKAEKR